MKNLLLLRHASPQAKGTDGTDFTRPLTALGEQEARLQGAFLREAGIVPDLVASSTAQRALTTARLLLESMGTGPPVTADESLYNAPGEVLLDYVQRLPERAAVVLLVAHMPGVAELLGLLASDPADISVPFGPCTLVGISLESAARWAEVVPGSGVVEWLLPPLFAR